MEGDAEAGGGKTPATFVSTDELTSTPEAFGTEIPKEPEEDIETTEADCCPPPAAAAKAAARRRCIRLRASAPGAGHEPGLTKYSPPPFTLAVATHAAAAAAAAAAEAWSDRGTKTPLDM